MPPAAESVVVRGEPTPVLDGLVLVWSALVALLGGGVELDGVCGLLAPVVLVVL